MSNTLYYGDHLDILRCHICMALFVIAVACVGCSRPSAPLGASGPPFKMPPTGDATDSLLRIGDAFPDIQSVDLDGNAITFDKALLGERCTLIVFWSTWCGFCMYDLPHEIELAKRYEPAGLRVIGINADSTTEIAKAAAKQNAVPWLNLFEGPDKVISSRLRIQQWPTLILLGPDGKVVMTTPTLRSISGERLPDGSVRDVSGLDWALEELLGGK